MALAIVLIPTAAYLLVAASRRGRARGGVWSTGATGPTTGSVVSGRRDLTPIVLIGWVGLAIGVVAVTVVGPSHAARAAARRLAAET